MCYSFAHTSLYLLILCYSYQIFILSLIYAKNMLKIFSTFYIIIFFFLSNVNVGYYRIKFLYVLQRLCVTHLLILAFICLFFVIATKYSSYLLYTLKTCLKSFLRLLSHDIFI